MQLALTGLPGAGVKTIFTAVCGLNESAAPVSTGGLRPGRVTTLKAPDKRLSMLSEIYHPQKTTPAAVEIAEYPGLWGGKTDAAAVGRARQADALVLVLRSFDCDYLPQAPGGASPERDLADLDAEMVLADLMVVERRIERVDKQAKSGKSPELMRERAIMTRCQEHLERGLPLRDLELTSEELKPLRSFGLFTIKPRVAILNLGEDQLPQAEQLADRFGRPGLEAEGICGDLEAELATMEEDDRRMFMDEWGIKVLAAPAVLSAAYRCLDTITFFTYGEDECRAWTLRRGDTAVDAAGRIHTDLARGFIRAEVVSMEDFQRYGSMKGTKAAGRFRLEGREYPVLDGDLVTIRHNA